MRPQRVWLEMVIVATAIACVLALLLATLGAAAGAAEGAEQYEGSKAAAPVAEQTFEGIIACSRCGARHSAQLDRSASTCVRICVHGGASFALVADDSTYLLDGNLIALKKLAGQRARIVGTR